MATTYTASLNVACWKQHNCVYCGAYYRYLFERHVSESASTQDGAYSNLERAVDQTLENAIELHPCPQCGVIQPDMVAESRLAAYDAALIPFGLVAVAAVVVGWMEWMTFAAMTPVLWCAAALAAMIFFFKSRGNPNRNPSANRQAAQRSIKAGKLALDQAGVKIAAGPLPGTAMSSPFLSGLILVALLVVPSAEIWRRVSGIRLNANCYPGVVGPGDTFRMYLPKSVNSIKGYWNAVSNVEMIDAGTFGLSSPSLASHSNRDSWGNSISVKESTKFEYAQVWVNVTLPDEPRLARQSVKLRTKLHCLYPQVRDSNTFEEAETDIESTDQVQLSSRRAGTIYQALTWTGFVGGSILLLTVGFALRSLAKRDSRRTQVRVFAVE